MPSGTAGCFGQRKEIRLISIGRPLPSIVAAATSSSSSVASTRFLLPSVKPKKTKYYQTTREKMTQKEKNILMTNPELGHQDPKKMEEGGTPSMDRSSGVHQAIAAISVSLCSLIVGFSSSYTSPALVSMSQPNSTHYIEITRQDSSWIGSLMPLAGLAGGAVGGTLIDLLGRKSTIMLMVAPFVTSYTMLYFAQSVSVIMAARVVVGFAIGVASLALPVYLGETLQPEVRGMYGVFPTTIGNTGILLCYLVGTYLEWRELAIFGAAIALPYFFLMFLLPETPRWYIENHKPEKAEASLRWLRGKGADIQNELQEMSHAESQEEKTTFFHLFQKKYLWPLGISLGLMFLQQMSGINVVIFYAKEIFASAGSTIDPNVSSVIIGLVNLASTVISTFLIDRLGRKVLMYISTLTMSVNLFVLGGFFFLFVKDGNPGEAAATYGWIPLVSLVTFVVGFSVGAGSIPWIMMGELLPAKIRGTGASIATSFNWACTFLVTKTFVDLKDIVGLHGAFWLFCSTCLCGFFFVLFFVPETAGKSLEDIEKRFSGQKVKPRSVYRMSIASLKVLPSTT